MIALAALCGIGLLAVITAAWFCIPAPTKPARRDDVPVAPVRVDLVRTDHRTAEQRETDQARTNKVWGLR